MNAQTRRWVRAGLVYLTVSFLVVGLWATLDPQGFYEGFPGAGRHWVAGDGPYNAHLMGDAGVGFLAVGAVLLLAAVWIDARLIQAAAAAAVLHDAPHLVFHLRHPNSALDSVDTALSNGGLVLGAAVSLAILVGTARAESRRGDKEQAELRGEPDPPVGSTGTHNGERKEAVR